MEIFWLLAGIVSTLAVLVLLLPWLRSIPALGPLPAVSWPVSLGALVALALVGGVVLKSERAAPAASAGTAAVQPGAPSGAMTSAGAGAAAPAGPANTMGGSMASAIASLESRLAKGGGSADDWELLAKSFEFIGRPADAALARQHKLPALPMAGPDLGQALQGTAPAAAPVSAPVLTADSLKLLAEADADRRAKKPAAAAAIYARLGAAGQLTADGWADYADTAAGLQGGKLAGQPESFIARALAIDPKQPKALWLAASAAEEGHRWGEAVSDWQRLAALLDPGSADARIVAANLQQDQKQLGAPAPATADSNFMPLALAGAATLPTGGSSVGGEVTLSDSLAARAASGTTLFIIAKSADAPGPPLAVMRTVAGSWPLRFMLDDSQAMMPGRNLSSAHRVTIEARISRSGQALPSSGDLVGTSSVVSVADHQPLHIVIDKVVP